MLKLIVFALIAVCIEVILLARDKNQDKPVKEDPMALPYTAYRVDEPGFGYIPGRSTYNEKTKRYVTDWKYEWEYQGKKHTMMVSDDQFSQYEHYMAEFPEETGITIHKKTGKYYVSKSTRAASRHSLFILLFSMVLSWIITSMIFR